MSKLKKLNRRSFKNAMHKGLGRALLHVKQYGDENVRNELSYACANNIAFDPQSEGFRACWLAEIVDFAKEPEHYYRYVETGLSSAKTNWDLTHVGSLAAEFAKRGIGHFRPLLYNAFTRSLDESKDWSTLGLPIFSLDGVKGACFVLEELARRPIKNWEDPCHLLLALTNDFGEENAIHALQDSAKTCKRLRRLLPIAIREIRREIPAPQQRAPYTLEQVLKDIERSTNKRGVIERGFGKRANDEDIREIFSLLLEETRTRRLYCYLRVFHMRALPELHDRIFELALSSNRQVRLAACTALSHRKSTRVRQFALNLLHEDPSSIHSGALELLRLNYRAGDHVIIAKSLRGRLAPETIHSIVLDLVLLAREIAGPELADCLHWAYEHTPCSSCRQSVVDKLIKWNAAPPELLEECLWDCEYEIRELARNALGRVVMN